MLFDESSRCGLLTASTRARTAKRWQEPRSAAGDRSGTRAETVCQFAAERQQVFALLVGID
jgi:hypothetical protein